MERTPPAAHRWRPPVLLLLGTLVAIVLRRVLWALTVQLAAGALLMLISLPLCRCLERRLPATAAAALSLLLLGTGAVLLMLLILPPLIRQIRLLTGDLPGILDWLRTWWQSVTGWLAARGLDVAPLQSELFARISGLAGRIASTAMNTAGRIAGAAGRLLLSPLLAFYLLRDRKRIAVWLTLLLPVRHRTQGVRAAREMRRETAAFLRGQLLLSLSVGALTALGLLLTGTPGWLLLGLLMGVMELVPYVGPILAGIPAVLLSMQNGWSSALWTVAVLFGVQQAEGTLLSPRLLAGATQLHPLTVLLLISAGGMLGGTAGMMLVLPAVVSVRGALRGWRA